MTTATAVRSPAAARRFRGPLAKGLKQGVGHVDRAKGIIYGYSVITRGEALGHGLWIDGTFLDQIVAAPPRGARRGFKTRFTHPGLCSDGLGKYLGRTRNLRRDGDQVRGDLFLAGVAKNAPGNGDLSAYVMDLAEEDPEAFAASIVFFSDHEAEDEFVDEHTAYDEELERKVFRSPDPDNEHNYRHARLARLWASDVVDEPAANPGGFFSSADTGALAEAADRWLDWAIGVGDEDAPPPDEVLLGTGIESERARDWLSGYLTRRGLEIVSASETPGSADPETSAGASDQKEEKLMAEEEKQTVEPTVASDAEALKAARTEGVEAERARFARLQEKWPERAQFVTEQFAKGHDVAEAEGEFKDLEIAELKEKLAAATENKPEPKAGEEGAEAAPFSQAPEAAGDESLMALAETRAREKGISLADAMSEVAAEKPELAEKLCLGKE